MRAMFVIGLVWLVTACGASSGATRDAKEARYNATADVVWQGILDAVEADYKVEAHDRSTGEVRTAPRWYEPDGTSEDLNSDDHAVVEHGSILLSLHVAMKGEEGAWYVVVKPLAAQYRQESPQPMPLKEGDIDMPGWVHGKVDNLYLAINARLKDHQILMQPK